MIISSQEANKKRSRRSPKTSGRRSLFTTKDDDLTIKEDGKGKEAEAL